MGKSEDTSSNSNLIEEAWTVLEYSDYAGLGFGRDPKMDHGGVSQRLEWVRL